MYRFTFFTLLVSSLCLCSCKTENCDNKGEKATRGLSYNKLRIQYGAPIIHGYMCFDPNSAEVERWEAPVDYQLSAVTGFHAGKGVFLQTEAELDEKDIYRHRIDDSTFEFIGIITEVHNGVVSFPNIWYNFIDVKTIRGEHSERVFTDKTAHFSLEQADSILAKWGTGRR